MSVVAPSQKRLWLPALAGMAVAAVAILVSLNLAAERDTPLSRSNADNPPSIAAPEAEQAKWRMKMYPAGVATPMSKAERSTLRAQRPVLSTTVRDIYDALFLAPGEVDDALKRYFTPDAARRLRSMNVGVGRGVDMVATETRVARIGIDASRANKAAASVVVEAKGKAGEKTIHMFHKATLWLERNGRSWKVIAFDLVQRPRK